MAAPYGGGMSNDLPATLGRAIRVRRIALGYSQEGFADHLEMHRTYYGAIERGEKNMTLDTIARVCRALDVEPWRLLKEAAEKD